MKKNTIYTISLIAFFLIIYTFILYNPFFAISTSTGESMIPTLKESSLNIYVFTDKIGRNSIYNMMDPDSYEKIVKRVVALPGDIIEIKDNKIFINGVEEKATYSLNADYTYDEGLSITVPKNEYFVLGDNRNVSIDSRYFGTVPEEYIKSKLILAIY